MSVIQDRPEARVPISVEAFDAIVFTFFSFAALTTIARVYLWSCVLRCGVLDNVLIFIGTLLTLAVTLLGHFEVEEINKLVKTVPGPDAPGPAGVQFLNHFNLLYRYGEIANLVYLIALPVIKCAILAFYRKIVVTKMSVYILYAVAFAIIGQGVGNFIASLYDGLKDGSIWNVVNGSFRDPVNTTNQIVNSSFQIVFDVILLLIPLPVLRGLKIKSGAKVGLLVVYAVSFVSLVATAMRLYKVTNFFYTTGPDAGSVKADLSYWTIIELTTAIFCANLPALSSLLRFARGRLSSRYDRKSSFSTPSGAQGKRLGKAPDANGYTSSSRKKGGPRLWPLSVLNSCSSRASSNNSKDGMSKATYDDNLTDFDFSYKSRNRDDEHSCNAQIRGGDNSGENGRSPSSDERYRNGKNGTSVTVEQQLPIDGIYKTYEFSAVVEKGAVF